MKGLGLEKALVQSSLRDGVAGVFGEVALPAERIQPHKNGAVDAEGVNERLYGGLVVSGLAAQRAVAVRMKSSIREHADCRVRACEAGFRTDLAYPGIGDVSGRALEQTPHCLPGGGDLLKAYADQVFQAH